MIYIKFLSALRCYTPINGYLFSVIQPFVLHMFYKIYICPSIGNRLQFSSPLIYFFQPILLFSDFSTIIFHSDLAKLASNIGRLVFPIASFI